MDPPISVPLSPSRPPRGGEAVCRSRGWAQVEPLGVVWAAVEFVGGDRVIERYHGPIGRFCCRLGSVCVHAHMIILEYIENRLRCMLQSALLDGKDRTGPRGSAGCGEHHHPQGNPHGPSSYCVTCFSSVPQLHLLGQGQEVLVTSTWVMLPRTMGGRSAASATHSGH